MKVIQAPEGVFFRIKWYSAKYNANDEPYWEATLHQAATCCYPEGGYLMEVQLHKVTSILP